MLEKYFTWLAEVLLIIVVGLVFITLHSFYYSYGMMIFGEHSAAAIEMFGKVKSFGVAFTLSR
ncbi:hypothetical protein [Lactobacillus delbrueckii]|uniref:hypothetical protein n=1 Tax=Lactobacillus delbrueckii TaxID=1584 RepID=UPI001E2C5FF3|nr:hypothetical protein [Lactobacillus delbrueckii]MCD5452115.1 hypothetical protein [Lactobacillus delbrueckii subsp. lactis]